MEKYKIICIVTLTVLSFQIRGSHSRSLNDDELEHSVSEKSGNIEDWTTECACFPETVKGTHVSKFLPSNEQIDRLVVYFYKNKISGELTYYIPSWKKQINFPDLTFDIGDKLETGTIDGIINLFDTATYPEGLQNTTVTNGIPIKNVVTVNPGEHLEITNIPSSGNQYKNDSGTSPSGVNQITVEIPSKELTVSVVSPENDKKITTGVNTNQDLNLSLGNNQQPIQGTINVPNQNLKPIENQQTPVTSGGSLANLLPGKPGTEGETIIINSPKNQIEISNKPENQKLVSPIGQKTQLINVPHGYNNNLNLAINRLSGLGDLMKYVLPGHGVLVSPSESNNGISSSWIDQTDPNKQTNLVNIGHLPSKYNSPSFNNWFNKQIVTLRSERPSMSKTINFHLLKLLLIKALHDNGISISENGELRDSNGNILKMTNLKIRPILLGDPMDYQKLIDTKTCVIPYDLPYLEAVLVTLIYPPRILAIIPLGVENAFISSLPGRRTQNLCGHWKCHTSESFRSGSPEKEEDISDLNGNKDVENNDVDPHNTEPKSEEPITVYSDNIESKNTYTYIPEDFSLEPGISRIESMYRNDIIPIGFKKTCGHKYCQINRSFRSGSPEKEEDISDINGNKDVENNDVDPNNTEAKSEEPITVYSDNIESKNAYTYTPEDFSLEPGISRIDSMYRNDIIPIGFKKTCGHKYCQINGSFRSGLNEVLNKVNDEKDDNARIAKESGTLEDNDENFLFEEVFGKTVENNDPRHNSNKATTKNEYSNAERRNNLPLAIIDNSQNSLFQPSQIIYTQPQFDREVFYLDKNGNVEGQKSLDGYGDALPEIPQTPDEEDYDMLHIRIVGGNPATSSGTPVSSRGR